MVSQRNTAAALDQVVAERPGTRDSPLVIRRTRAAAEPHTGGAHAHTHSARLSPEVPLRHVGERPPVVGGRLVSVPSVA